MINKFIVYIATGEILRSGSCCLSDVSLQAQSDEFVIEGEGQDDTHWVDTSVPSIMEKTVLVLSADKETVLANGEDCITISDIPSGVTVALNDNPPVEVLDTAVVFKTLDLGTHSLVFSGIKYLPLELAVKAV